MVCMKQRAIFWALDFLQSHDRVLAHLRPRRKNLSTNIWSAQPGDTSGFPGALRHSNILSTSRQLPSNNCLQTGSSTYPTWRWFVNFPQILFPPRSYWSPSPHSGWHSRPAGWPLWRPGQARCLRWASHKVQWKFSETDNMMAVGANA